MSAKRQDILLDLIRCGETTWEAEARLHGATDLPLSPEGRASVCAAIVTLAPKRFAVVFHPPDEAATDSAHIVAEAVGAKTKAVAELAEPDLGLIDGLTEKDFAERFPKRHKQWKEDPLSLVPPEGEAFGDAQARTFRACAKILRRSRGDRTAIVLRPLALGFVRCWLADRPAGDVWASLANRPQIEQYLVAQELVESLEQAARAEPLNA
ncbi:MAG: histidine phosphatase family protein [Planctomycetes bacterium]|nr:histidine phosphatase family protein [Planctomycetota bacterium]